MTLGDGKRKVYMLLDEYSSGGTVTEDADIEKKMADFFDIAQKEAAKKQAIRRSWTVERAEGVTEYAPPEDFVKQISVWRGQQRCRRFEWRAGKLLIPETEREAVTVEYAARPQTVTPGTPDSYEFEVSEEACNALPYFVASQQLIADLVMDYTGLYAIWQQMLETLPATDAGCGGIRNVLFRG